MRKIKLNRDLGRRGSSEAAPSDRSQSGTEKSSSGSDRSAALHGLEGDRHRSTSEGAGRKETSASADKGASRERPGSAGDRQRGSDRERDRERDRPPASDRDKESGSNRDRDRPRASEDRDEEGEKEVKTERKNPSSGSGAARSVSVDKMTIGEKSAFCKKLADQEKPSGSCKERMEGAERAAKPDRLLYILLCCLSHSCLFPCLIEPITYRFLL